MTQSGLPIAPKHIGKNDTYLTFAVRVHPHDRNLNEDDAACPTKHSRMSKI